MAVQRMLTWHTGSNVFDNEDEYISFIENFTEITNPLKNLRDRYISEGKITSFRRELGNNTISFITVFTTVADKNAYIDEAAIISVSPWLESLGWTKVDDTVSEL